MQTTDKALSLLSYFSETRPQIGLSDFARLAGFDKATTRRLLMALIRNGLVEQHPQTKKYRLGANILSLARIREETFPVANQVRPILRELVIATGETAHFSMFSGGNLHTIEKIDSPHSMRVNVSYSDPLPLHCTASGLAYLAYQPITVLKDLLGDLQQFTPKTIIDERMIRVAIADARRDGVAVIDSGFELDVIGISAAVFDWTRQSCGAVAVATPGSRMNKKQSELTKKAVTDAARKITKAFGSGSSEELLSA